MAQQPSELPEWATVPTPGDTGAVTAPTLTRRRTGFLSGRNVVRGYLNWILNLLAGWVVWLSQVTTRLWRHLAPDQALPEGTPPPTGGTLAVLASSFTASAIIDGNLVGPVASPAHTYAANADTYWDLGVDAVWRPVNVASGSPAPAVTASPVSVRVYRVRTNGSTVTQTESYRRARATLSGQLAFFASPRFGVGRLYRESAAQVEADVSSGSTYLLVLETTPVPSTAPIVRVYLRASTMQLVVTRGARWDEDVAPAEWVIEQDNATRVDIGNGQVRTYRSTFTAPQSISDASWTSHALGVNPALEVAGGLVTGRDARGITPHWTVDRANSGSVRYEPLLLDTTDGRVRTYIATSTSFAGWGLVEAINARWDQDNTRWERVTAGDSSLRIQRLDGVRQYRHEAGGSATWSDAATTGNWAIHFRADALTHGLFGSDVRLGRYCDGQGGIAIVDATMSIAANAASPRGTVAAVVTVSPSVAIQAGDVVIGRTQTAGSDYCTIGLLQLERIDVTATNQLTFLFSNHDEITQPPSTLAMTFRVTVLRRASG